MIKSAIHAQAARQVFFFPANDNKKRTLNLREALSQALPCVGECDGECVWEWEDEAPRLHDLDDFLFCFKGNCSCNPWKETRRLANCLEN